MTGLLFCKRRRRFDEYLNGEDGIAFLPGFCSQASEYCNLLQAQFAACAAQAA
jgi:hypothetical protein